MPRYADIVFLQGDDFNEFEGALYPNHTPGSVVLEGPPDVEAALAFLQQFDYGDGPGEVRDAAPWGPDDDTHTADGYVMSWNVRLGYAGLVRVLEAETAI